MTAARSWHSFALGVALLSFCAPQLARAAGVAVDEATPQQMAEAKSLYGGGVAAMESERLEVAREQFAKSYDVVASPNSRLMLARALVKLERLAEAYRELKGVVAEATVLGESQAKYLKTAQSAETELNDLRARIALVTVNAGTTVAIDGSPVPPSDWEQPIPLPPGTAEVSFESSDGRRKTKTLELEAGEAVELEARLPPPPRPVEAAKVIEKKVIVREPCPRGALDQSTIGYIAGGVGLLGLGTFGYLTFVVGTTDHREGCAAGVCSTANVDAAKTDGTNVGLSYASLGLGVAGLGLGAVLLLTDKDDSVDASARSARLVVGPAALRVEGEF